MNVQRAPLTDLAWFRVCLRDGSERRFVNYHFEREQGLFYFTDDLSMWWTYSTREVAEIDFRSQW